MSDSSTGNAKNLGESRKQALQALITSLAPNGSEENKLNEEQIEALSDRLSRFLGNVDDGPEVRRNGKGEVLSEEGLPIIDISEPINDSYASSQSSEAFLTEHDPPPLSSMTDQERRQLRIRRDRILDMLEEEERRDSDKELERERARRAEEVAKMDAKSKAAAREMQKKMGKALLKNLAAQREREEEEKKKAEEDAASKVSSQNGDASCKKPKKKVSFVNLPEVDETKQKPKPPIAWGDVSVAKLKAGVPKAKLKAEALSSQPMKSEVVERIPGAVREPLQERDSDDESDPDLHTLNPNEEAERESSRTPNGYFENDDVPEEQGDKSVEDEFDFSQARMQREMALEYFRLRESVGAEARRVMSSHTHEREDEWNQSRVPLDASLTSKPSKSGVSRFKAARQAAVAGSNGDSISLGASVLPQGKSSTLQRAVRTGKLENGHLVGGEVGESGSEGDEDENVTRTIEMLKNGLIVDDKSPSSGVDPGKTKDIPKVVTADAVERMTFGPSSSSQARTSNPVSQKTSRFKAGRTAQGPATGPIPGLSTHVAARSSPLSNTDIDRSESTRPANSALEGDSLTAGEQATPNEAFKKSPTAIPVPSAPPSHRPFAIPQIPPDPAVLNSTIVDSPSFPQPSTDASTRTSSRPLPLVSEVRESSTNSTTRRAVRSEEPTTAQRTGKVSRFMAERL